MRHIFSFNQVYLHNFTKKKTIKAIICITQNSDFFFFFTAVNICCRNGISNVKDAEINSMNRSFHYFESWDLVCVCLGF